MVKKAPASDSSGRRDKGDEKLRISDDPLQDETAGTRRRFLFSKDAPSRKKP
jgi:hypothetical protein